MICSICATDKPLESFVYRKDRQRYQSHCKACKLAIDKRWSSANKDLRKASKTKCDRKLRKHKPIAKLKDNLRTRLNTAIKTFTTNGNISHIRHLGCTVPELVSYIESQFHSHPVTDLPMTWDNKGNGHNTWQIDHILPFSNAVDKEDLLKVVHYTNLRPVWWDEYLIKSATERRERAD